MSVESNTPTITQEEIVVQVAGVPLPSQSTRKQIVVATILYCWTTILLILRYGEPTNSLHTSALAWLFASFIGVIFAYVFGAVADNYNVLRKIPNKNV